MKAALLLLSALATTTLAQPVQQAVYTWDRDIAYTESNDPNAQERCRLDVYYPESPEAGTTPITVVWLHAGGLKRGSRYVPGQLRNKNYIVVAADYRLNPQATTTNCIEDAAAATAWAIDHAADYGGSPDRVVVAGASAGAYLAMMVGLDDRWLAPHGIDPTDLLGIGSIAGQCIDHVAVREEQGIARDTPVISDMAPLYHVRADAPPLLLVTGDRNLELLARYEENALMEHLMRLKGHTQTELFELEGFDHAGTERPAHGLFLQWLAGLDRDTHE